MKADQILSFFQTTRMGPNSSATLVGLDRVVRLRFTDGLHGVGRKITKSRLWGKLKDAPAGVYHQTSIIDGTPRIWAYKKLSSIPLVAVIGAAIPDAYAAIDVSPFYFYAIAGLFSLIVCVLLILSIREKKAADRSEILEATFQNMNQGIAVFDARHRLAAYNEKFSEITELPDDFLRIGLSREDLLRFRISQRIFGEGDVETIAAKTTYELTGPTHHDRTLPSGRIYDYERVLTPYGGYIFTVTDVTADRRAKHRLEQAQRMEVVGQMTGGVAHDFNNLLAVIMGNAELVSEGPHNRVILAEKIMRAAQRGAELTQHLLSFSRKQTLQPRQVDMSGLVARMQALMQRTLDETIEIATDAAPDLWHAQADPGQLESGLLNLAFNARDAMPGGGTLTIRAANVSLGADGLGQTFAVEPGDYVMVEVSDTGTGMSEDALEHAFEPFFTTKDVGQGSGLGLSMVYGFAKQSGGYVTIANNEGKGASVALYLPRVPLDTLAEELPGVQEIAVPMGRGEAILVLEDDKDMRELAKTMITTLGYRVTTASTAAEAKDVLQSQNIDLVLSDVALKGGVNGPTFARLARDQNPALQVIFMSGYPADVISRDGIALSPDDILLAKPFNKQAIASALDKALKRQAT